MAVSGDDDEDNTGTVVALVISGLLVVALLISLLTYRYWRNTRPRPAADSAAAHGSGTGRTPGP